MTGFHQELNFDRNTGENSEGFNQKSGNLINIWRISIRIQLKDLKDFDQNSDGELAR